LPDILKIAVYMVMSMGMGMGMGMTVVVVMTVPMVAGVVIMMVLIVVVIMSVIVMFVMVVRVVGYQFHIHSCSRDGVALIPTDPELISRYTQLFQLPFQIVLIHAQIDKGCQVHIPTDAGKTIII
jgi:hypothetical protein